MRKNGVDVPSTNSEVILLNSYLQSRVVPAWNFMVRMNAGDYFQVMWSSADINAEILAIPPQVNPTRPAVPSLILTVQQAA